MTISVLVSVRGESHSNEDGTPRQEIIKKLRRGQKMSLEAEPTNPYDRWAVKVLTEEGEQIGYLESNAKDAGTLLRGEPITANVARLTGGINWFNRTVLGKKHIGVVLRLVKDEPDWSRFNKLRGLAKPYDVQIEEALVAEKTIDAEEAISMYETIVEGIVKFTAENPQASAHRWIVTPVDRLSLLLERQKRYQEALAVINNFLIRFDPIQTKRGALIKRKARLENELAKPYDVQIEEALVAEKTLDAESAISTYEAIVESIVKFTDENPQASAHRRKVTPVNRLSLLLERQKRYQEALAVINNFLIRFDPIKPNKTDRDTLIKRKARLEKKITA